jgi:hypothetical protein
MLVACSGRDQPAKEAFWASSGAWLATRDSVTIHLITPDEDLCTTCIHLEKVTELGKSDDPDGFIQPAFYVYRDAKARYWVVQGSEIKLFNSRGEFLRKVGAAGRGPGEWRTPKPATDSAGRIQILDASNGRITRLDEGFKVDAESPMPGLQINSLASIGPSSFVVSAWAVAADIIGQPLHVFENGKISRSFGAPEAGGVQSVFSSRRVVGSDRRGHIVTSKPYSFDVEVWTVQGERVLGASGPSLNQHEVLPGAYDLDRNPPASEVRGISLDSVGRLWVVTSRVKPDWKSKYEERVYPGGYKSLVLKPGYTVQDSRFTRVEVVDMAAGKIIAQLDVPQVLFGFVSPDAVWENPLPDADEQAITIWRLKAVDAASPKTR